jgi:hypothetical protein
MEGEGRRRRDGLASGRRWSAAMRTGRGKGRYVAATIGTGDDRHGGILLEGTVTWILVKYYASTLAVTALALLVTAVSVLRK